MDDVQAPVDSTLRKAVVIFRLLGWGWMALVAALVLVRGDLGQVGFVWASLAVATVWTIVTLVAARSDDLIRSAGFVIADGVTALAVGLASTAAESPEIFHGGYPMSWVLVAAYRGGLGLALPASALLAIEQWFVRVDMGRPAAGAAFSVVFLVFAVLAGWTFDTLREQSRRRTEAERRLSEVETERARVEERAAIGMRLHDSVLQTLHAIQVEADEGDRVRHLARRQERELRRTIEEYLSLYENSFRVALLSARDDVEELHPVVVNAVIRHDAAMTSELAAVVDAAREGMMNAAHHAGVGTIDLYAALEGEGVEVRVRDRGTGFEPGKALGGGGLGIARSLVARVEEAGGEVEIVSSPGSGTEVRIRMGDVGPQPLDESASSGRKKPDS